MPRYIDADLILPEMESKLDMQELYLPVHFQEFIVGEIPTADVAPVRHGRWLYEVHKENVNFRWNVTVKCSECYDNRKEIWGGFFPNVPDCIARDVAIHNAKQIKLDNYCPHCGAKLCRGE